MIQEPSPGRPYKYYKESRMLKRIILVLLSICLLIQFSFGESETEGKDSEEQVYEVMVSISSKLIIPISTFANFYDHGTGTSLDFYIKNVFLQNSGLSISLAALNFKPLTLNESSILTVPLTLYTNYVVQLNKRLSIIPYMGFGYLMHMITSVNARDFYFNPLVSIKNNIQYQFVDQLFIFLGIGYSLYFEQSNIGQFVNFDVGLRILIE